MAFHLAETPWLAGRTYSLADIAAFPMVAAIPRLQPETMNGKVMPHAMDRLRRMDVWPAVQEARTMPNKVPETIHTFAE